MGQIAISKQIKQTNGPQPPKLTPQQVTAANPPFFCRLEVCGTAREGVNRGSLTFDSCHIDMTSYRVVTQRDQGTWCEKRAPRTSSPLCFPPGPPLLLLASVHYPSDPFRFPRGKKKRLLAWSCRQHEKSRNDPQIVHLESNCGSSSIRGVCTARGMKCTMTTTAF